MAKVLAAEQQKALNLLISKSADELQTQEKQLVAKLLADAVTDTAINKIIREKLRAKDMVDQASDVLDLAFTTRHQEAFAKVFITFSEQFIEIKRAGKLSEEQPQEIVLRNYAMVRSMARLLPDLNNLHKAGVLADKLADLHEKVKKCDEMIKILDKQFGATPATKPGLFAHEERPHAYFKALLTAFNAVPQQKQQLRPS